MKKRRPGKGSAKSASFSLKEEIKKVKIAGIVIGVLLLLIISFLTFMPNLRTNADKYYLYVPKDYTISQLSDTLYEKGVLKNTWTLKLLATLTGVDSLRNGLFELNKNAFNASIIYHLATDSIKPFTKLEIPSYQLRKNIIDHISKNLEINKQEMWDSLKSRTFLSTLGDYNKESIFTIFIPGTYYFYKNSSVPDIIQRMNREYNHFWNDERKRKASEIGLNPVDVSILASIVYCETKLPTEMPKIAGVYLNRLDKNMRLESDPTVVYAAKKFNVKRVLFKDRAINSRYNTYRKKGLPPGPIHFPPTYAIDAVLDREQHEYLYFCAKEDMSGCHNFASNFEEHKENARRYRQTLDSKGIYQ